MIAIIGQAPGAKFGSRPGRAFEGPTGARLAYLAGLPSYDELARRARLLNLLRAWPGKVGWMQGDAFPMARAKAAAERLADRLPSIPYLEHVLLAGRAVANAFRIDAPFFEWRSISDVFDVPVAVVPHPSGVSRWWNDRKNERRAKRFLREVFAC